MSSTTSLVKELLDQKSTLKGRRSGGETESAAISQADLRETVREGVAEALAEHERTYHADEMDERSGIDDADIDTDDQSSGGGFSKKGLLLLVILVAYLVRRRRNQSQSSDY